MNAAARSFAIALIAFALVCSCGKKAPPRWVEKLPPGEPGQVSLHYRPDRVVIKWEPPREGEEPDEYMVYRSEDGGPFEELDNTGRTSFVDRDLSPGTVYRYRITARAGRLESGAAESADAGSVALSSAPDLKAGVVPEGVGLSWGDVPGATGYNVYRSYSRYRFPPDPLDPAPVLGTDFVDRALPEDDAHYIVRAVINSPGGQVFSEGPPSDAATVLLEDFMPSAPTGLAATPAEGKVLVYWEQSPEKWVRGFRIYRARGEKGRFTRIGESRTPAFPDRKPRKGVLRYSVSAMGPEEEGPRSKPVTVRY